MRQSNAYIIIYSAVLTIACGGILAFASISLKDEQDANIALEQKRNILSTVMPLGDEVNVDEVYRKRVRSFVIDFNGNIVQGLKPEQVVIAAEYKKAPQDRLLPVYEFRSESDSTKKEFAVLPVYGFGLWNNIWGYVALADDFSTVQGVKFQHAGETPGLGARIDTEEIQLRYKGKSVFNGAEVATIVMQKGEGNDYSSDAHKVDGMSGATLTAKGVNNMLKDYFASYANYLKKNHSPNQAAL